MDRGLYSQQMRVSLKLKSVLILSFVVMLVTMSGGWFYLRSAQTWMHRSAQEHAERMAQTLGVAAQHDLEARRDAPLQRLAGDLLRDESVLYVALMDAEGTLLASASREGGGTRWSWLAALPPTVSSMSETYDHYTVLARPVVVPTPQQPAGRMVGAVRLVQDHSRMRGALARARQRLLATAAAIILCAIPLGYLLVWRIIVLPVRRLARSAGQLAEGDFDARAGFRGNDEIGELAFAFDTMACQVSRMRQELVCANERLEQKVQQRTEQLQQANGRLREEMAEKEDFLRAVSHDLNAPLRNIAGIVTMILMKWRDELPEEVVARLQRIQANADVDMSLISELLELSRVKTRPMKRRVVDMRALVEDLGRTFDHELKARGIELHIAADMPELYVERARMRQVFQNLLDNAIKYMHRPTGGLIEVSCRFAEGMHCFRVRDNGPGVAAEDHRKIFYVFRRSDGAPAEAAPGKGVGLALVKSVVSNYGGRAWVESEPGKGAAFHVALEAHCTQTPDTPQPALASAAATGNGGGK